MKPNNSIQNKIYDTIQTIGGILTLLYMPLAIGLIWTDSWILFKLLLTNSVLILFCRLLDKVYDPARQD